MGLQAKLIVLLATILLSFGSGYGVRAYIASKEKLAAQVSTLKAQVASDKDYQIKVDARDKVNQNLNNTIHVLDTTSTRNLNEKLAENDLLRHDLASAQRMRFNGAVCPQRPTGSETGSTGSVGDGAGLELTADSRQDVLDLRAGIIRDHAKIDYLHQYIWKLGLDPMHLLAQ